MTAESLDKITENLQPKARHVAKSIIFPQSMSQSETIVSNHLLRFIRERDQKELGLFLRYCTGSDLFLSKTIQVTFKEMSEFSRRPIAHTCTLHLELASDYSTYAEFRAEFCSVIICGQPDLIICGQPSLSATARKKYPAITLGLLLVK